MINKEVFKLWRFYAKRLNQKSSKMKKKKINQMLDIALEEITKVKAENAALVDENFKLAQQNEFLLNRPPVKYLRVRPSSAKIQPEEIEAVRQAQQAKADTAIRVEDSWASCRD
jgi:TATA-binding protein-associated factor Taf7